MNEKAVERAPVPAIVCRDATLFSIIEEQSFPKINLLAPSTNYFSPSRNRYSFHIKVNYMMPILLKYHLFNFFYYLKNVRLSFTIYVGSDE